MKCFFHICLLSVASIVIFNSCTKNNNSTTGSGGTGVKPPDSIGKTEYKITSIVFRTYQVLSLSLCA